MKTYKSYLTTKSAENYIYTLQNRSEENSKAITFKLLGVPKKGPQRKGGKGENHEFYKQYMAASTSFSFYLFNIKKSFALICGQRKALIHRLYVICIPNHVLEAD